MLNRIYIPSKDRAGRPLGVIASKFATQAKLLLSSLGGGYTAYEAVGGWNGSHGLIEESVTVVECFRHLRQEQAEQVRELARQWCRILNQESVMIMIDSQPEFIDATQTV